MKSVKRFEIIIERLHARDVTDALESAGVTGYSMVRDVIGTGDRGDRAGDELTDVFRNCCIIVAVPVEVANHVIEAIRPLLKAYGGVCLVSDALWVNH